MATIKYDVSDTEEFADYSGPVPKRGVYTSKVQDATFAPSGSGLDMFTIILHIEDSKKEHKQYNGCPLWSYVVLGDLSEEYQKRNLKMLVKALGMKEKGAFDPEKVAKALNAKQPKLNVLVYNETYEGDLQAKVKRLLPLNTDAAEDEGDEPEGDEPDGDEPDGDEPEGDGDEVDLDALDRKELKAYIAEKEYDITVTKAMSDEDVRTAIREEEEEYDEEERRAELATLDRSELKTICGELEITVLKKHKEADLINLIVEAEMAEPDDGDEPEGNADEPPF